ncbi:MAG: SAM-dependent methyltransferase [Lachnospiraceae bacterium]|nr:SAM-dependent methyltransferase [Lachnospiraceae bacterium]
MLAFLKQYLKNPRTVGAIAPSGRGLALKMMEPIDFDHARCIVEYGPGTGAFTRELVKRKRRGTRLILIEQNEEFYRMMRDKYDGKRNISVIYGSAEDACSYIQRAGVQYVDYVVSGLPFTSLPKDVSIRIFKATRKLIGKKGRFVTFQYTLIKKKFFESYFRFENRLFELKNLPPAYVFVLRK